MSRMQPDPAATSTKGVLRYEAIVWPAIAGLVLVIFNLRAFDNFFYGEDFTTRTLYIDADHNLFKAIFTSFGSGQTKFFRPTAVVWSIGTQLVLPWDPWWHHLRNVVFSLVNIVLLHRILLHVSNRPDVRLLALLFFSVSAIHFTIIGLINCVDNAGTLLLALFMALFALRALRWGRASDAALALAFYACECFARDYSLVTGIFIVTLCLAPGMVIADYTAGRRLRYGMIAGVVAAAALYLTVRVGVVGWPRAGDSNSGYSVSLQISLLFERLAAFVGLLFNAPVLERYRGALGFGLFNQLLPTATAQSAILAWIFFAICISLTIITTIAAMRSNRWAPLGLIWPAALIGPPLLVANLQAYYAYEPAAFAAIALAMLLTKADPGRRYLVSAWAVLIALMAGVHAFSGARATSFAWGAHAAAVGALNRDVLSKHRGEPLTRLTLITPDTDMALFWRYLTDPPELTRQALITELLRSDHQMVVAIEAIAADAPNVALMPNRPDAPVYALTGISAANPAGSGFVRIMPPTVPRIEKFDILPRHIWKSWVAGAELNWSIEQPPVAHDGAALRIDLRGQSGVPYGMGGVRLLPPTGPFAFDVYLERPADIMSMTIYLTNAEGELVGSWSADFGASPQPAGWSEFHFVPGKDNDAGFRWQQPSKSGPAVALDIIFTVGSGRSATVYLDSVRSE